VKLTERPQHHQQQHQQQQQQQQLAVPQQHVVERVVACTRDLGLHLDCQPEGNAPFASLVLQIGTIDGQKLQHVVDARQDLPSLGSAEHGGNCKPCAFLHTKGCENGKNCIFCHICEPGEKKRRRKDKLEAQKVVRTTLHHQAAPGGHQGCNPRSEV